MRARRIENEWDALNRLAALNPTSLKVHDRGVGPTGEFFRVHLCQTQAPVRTEGEVKFRDCHSVEIDFPRFFPAAPIEVVLESPVFHPNVDPDTGFVCLWTHTNPGDTVVESLTRLQRVIAWDLANVEPDHVMQPDAAEWFCSDCRRIPLPCAFKPLIIPEACDGFEHLRRTIASHRRQRLS